MCKIVCRATLSALVFFDFLGVRTVRNKKKANETATSVRKDMRIDKDLLAKIDANAPMAAITK